MGRHWRIFPTLCIIAAGVSVRGQVNAAAYSNAQNAQRPISAQGVAASRSPLTSEFADLVLKTLDEWKVPGVAVAVIDGDEVYAEVRVLDMACTMCH
jgi:hypothetical protein